MLARLVSILSVALASATLPDAAVAAPILTSFITPSEVTFDGQVPPQPLPSEIPIAKSQFPFARGSYIWYCGAGVESCPATSGPSQVVFKLVFDVPSAAGGFKYDGAIGILADDYFALYVNDHLVGSSWLDDRFLDGPGTTPYAVSYAIADFQDYLQVGAANEITIFACNGRPPTTRVPPGQTTSGGWDGCPDPSQRLNGWLLVDGIILGDSPGGVQFAQSLSGFMNEGISDSGWTVATTVPQPGTLLLLLSAMPAMLLALRSTRCSAWLRAGR